MTSTNESTVINDIYDYIFRNDCNNCIDFVREFENSYVDTEHAKIHLDGDFGQFIIKIERA